MSSGASGPPPTSARLGKHDEQLSQIFEALRHLIVPAATAEHAAVTLGLAGEMKDGEAESRIAASIYEPPQRDDVTGLLRFCQGPDPEDHLLCFP